MESLCIRKINENVWTLTGRVLCGQRMMIFPGWEGYTMGTSNNCITQGKTLERTLSFVSIWSIHAKYYWLYWPRGETAVLYGKRRFAAIVTVHWRQPGTSRSRCVHICTQLRNTSYKTHSEPSVVWEVKWNLKGLNGIVSQELGFVSFYWDLECVVNTEKGESPWKIYKSQNYR